MLSHGFVSLFKINRIMSIKYGFCTCNAKHFQLTIAKKRSKKYCLSEIWIFKEKLLRHFKIHFDIYHLYDVNFISKIKCFYFKIKFTLVRSNFEWASAYWSVSWLQSQTRSSVSWPNSCVLNRWFWNFTWSFSHIWHWWGFFVVLGGRYLLFDKLSFLIFFAGMFLTPMPFRFRISWI